MDYKQKMKALEIVRNLDPEQIAAMMGVSVHTYNSYKSGSRVPGMDRMKQIADALGTDVNTLFYDNTDKLF